MNLTKEIISNALKVVEEKKKLWSEYIPNVEFDKYGRTVIAKLPTLCSSSVEDNILSKFCSDNYIECFNKYLATNGYLIRLRDGNYVSRIHGVDILSPDDFIDNYCHLKKMENDKLVKMKMSKVLAHTQELWESMHPIYGMICKEIKKLRNKGESFSNYDLANLTKDKMILEKGNLYCRYQELLNENVGSNELILSINPLDLLTSSGETDVDNNLNPTKFSSCWSLVFTEYENRPYRYRVTKEGCYSSPEGAVSLGSILNRGMLFIKNGNELKIDDDMTLFGYKERSHVWLDTKGVWLEKMYPNKSVRRKKELLESLKSNNVSVINEESISNMEKFEIQDIKGIKRYINTTGRKHLFLDRVAIGDRDFDLHYLDEDRCDFDYDNPDLDPVIDDEVECDGCECYIDVDGENYHVTHDDRIICDSCYEEYYFTCPICGEIHKIDEGIMNSENEMVCINCRSKMM